MTTPPPSAAAPRTPTAPGDVVQSLAHGAAGQALLHVERAQTGIGTWATAHAHITRAAAEPLDAGDSAGLFYGVPAIAFLLHRAADLQPRYRSACHTVDSHIARLAARRLTAATERITAGRHTTFREYDLLYGLVGIGRLLLGRSPGTDLLARILDYVVALTRPHRHDEDALPGWWVDHDPDPLRPTPGGHANAGMAHGAAGLMALLSLATLRGCVVPGQSEAIGALLTWFDQWRQDDHPEGPWWPQWITRHDLRAGHPTQATAGRPSWCYGAVGVARAHQLAALAIGDRSRQDTAEAVLLAALAHLDRITEPGLCHGFAGVYQTTFRAAQDARNPAVAAQLPTLAARLARAQPAVGNDGLLTGDTGVRLAQHTASTAVPPQSGWDACLLIT